MIKNFSDKESDKIFHGKRSKRFSQEIQRIAQRKLLMIDAAVNLTDLKIPPGNRLEKLKGKRVGQHSIRINEQWRVCFLWKSGNAFDVEIVDYHK